MIYTRNNKILVGPNGHLASNCPGVGDDCQYCDAGKTPKYLTVTISGFSSYGCVSGYSYSHNYDVDINGVYLLTQHQVGTTCSWIYQPVPQPFIGTHYAYDDVDCTGNVEEITMKLWGVMVRLDYCYDGIVRAGVLVRGGEDPYYRNTFFSGGAWEPIEGSCVAGNNIPNNCGSSYFGGGTATVQDGDQT